MSKYCYKCGALLHDEDEFCLKCGEHALPPAEPENPETAAADTPKPDMPPYTEQPAEMPPVRPAYTPPAVPATPPYGYQNPVYKPAAQKKANKPLIISIIVAAVVLAALLAVFLIPGILPAGPATGAAVSLKPLPSDLAVENNKLQIHCTYDAPDKIIPAIYRSMDFIVYLKCWSDNGSADVLVSVEIPGFTQKYEQKLSISRAETQLKIHPPLLDGATKSLNASKSAQLVVCVKNIATGDIIVQDSKPVELFSRYDMQWQDADGTPYYENFLAWLTPEAPEMSQLLRDSADSLNYLTGGSMTSIVGYQQVGSISHANITYAQAAAIMYTLANTYGVKYVNQSFSSTATNLQHVKTPTEVVNTREGLCCETAVTVASALQAMNMHAVMILLPGHMQTAVETWNNSGEYLLIETTALEAAATGKNFDSVVTYMTRDQWTQYVATEGYEVIDCDLAIPLQIQSID